MNDSATVAFEARLTRDERRRGGIFNTPYDVAAATCASLPDGPGVVLDPSCGTGTFLLAARERFGPSVRLIGVDVDPAAIALARERVPDAELHVGDGLAWTEPVDVVIGNPPYVDGLHARFLAHACRLADAVAMVVPASLLATNEGRAFRTSGLGVVSCTRLGRVFDASVDTCALVLRRGAPVPAGPTWSSLLVDAVPEVSLGDGERLGATCDVVAGFRQHYYGLRGCVTDGGPSPLRLVTSGAIDVGALNDRPVRFDGVRYASPRVSLATSPVRSWYEALLRPKVVVATQTRVIEATADVEGVVVPSVPVISVVPSDPARVWHALAVLLAPPVSAWAMRRWAGTALSASALKLGAPNVREIPVPSGAGVPAWSSAASLLRDGDVSGAGLAMCAAYDVGEEVHTWWEERRR